MLKEYVNRKIEEGNEFIEEIQRKYRISDAERALNEWEKCFESSIIPGEEDAVRTSFVYPSSEKRLEMKKFDYLKTLGKLSLIAKKNGIDKVYNNVEAKILLELLGNPMEILEKEKEYFEALYISFLEDKEDFKKHIEGFALRDRLLLLGSSVIWYITRFFGYIYYKTLEKSIKKYLD